MKEILPVIVLYRTKLTESNAFLSISANKNLKRFISQLFVYDNSPESPAEPDLGKNADLEVIYVSDTSNPGVSAAYNAAVRRATAGGFKRVLLFDQDTYVPDDFFETLFDAIRNAGSQVLFAPTLLNDSLIFSPCRFRLNRGFPLEKKLAPGVFSLQEYVPVNSGLCVTVEAYNRAGGYDERIPLDFSDFDFVERLKRAGLQEFVVTSSDCRHSLANVDDQALGSLLNRFRYFCLGAYYYERSFPGWLDRAKVKLILFLRFVRLTIKCKTMKFLPVYLSGPAAMAKG
jgi:GT2 family glycosyltransferase